MTRRIAVTLSLVAFALCVCLGIQADNTFATVVSKALVAMVVTLVVGLIVGSMAQKMLDENLAVEEKKLETLAASQIEAAGAKTIEPGMKPALQTK